MRKFAFAMLAFALFYFSIEMVFAHGEEAPPEQLHPQTQIGLPDAKAGHAHGGGAHAGHGGADMSALFQVSVTPAGPYSANTPTTLRITFTEKAAGHRITTFALTHTKPLHLIIVSSDLTEFYHEHPVLQEDGTFVLENFIFPREIEYVLYFDLMPEGASNIVLHQDVAVGAGAPITPNLAASDFPITYAGMRVDLTANPKILTNIGESALTFRLSDAHTGEPLNDIQAYLGAPAHLVMISENSFQYLHVHPLGNIPENQTELAAMRFGPEIQFAASFPNQGLYKGWLQIQRQHEVFVLPFVVSVAQSNGLTRDQVARLVHTTQQQEEFRSIIKFLVLTLLILGMIMLFYPKRPAPPPQNPQQPVQTTSQIEQTKTIT